MVAISGYGHYYLKTLLDEVSRNTAVLAGVVDPEAEKSGYINWIKENEIPVYARVEDFFTSHKADLTVISSPPQYHVKQTLIALQSGSNVLVDKPVGVGQESVDNLIRVSGETGKWVEVGYQWTFSDPIQELKRDILDGVYGDPIKGKAICLWPRDFDYYNRNSWAGKIRDNKGNPVYDSPVNNACAHFLHNLLFVFGDKMDRSAMPGRLTCERYRANNIDNFDTISLRMVSESGIGFLFYASHATENPRDPEFELEFTRGRVRYSSRKEGIVGENRDGVLRVYGAPDNDHQFKKLFHAIELCRIGGRLICPPEAGIAHTMCIDMIQNDNREISVFNPDDIIKDGNRIYVQGLNERLNKAYEECIMI